MNYNIFRLDCFFLTYIIKIETNLYENRFFEYMFEYRNYFHILSFMIDE